MNVKKIFTTLITIVASVVIGAMLLNVLLPNAAASIVDASEGMIFSATGMTFDFNNNGIAGGVNTGDYSNSNESSGEAGDENKGVEGFN